MLPIHIPRIPTVRHTESTVSSWSSRSTSTASYRCHYTLDRTWKGTDHAASLEPDGVRKLARDCRAVAKALTYKREDILDIEKVQRNKLKKNQVKW